MISICIPSLDDQGLSSEISNHFGKSPYFTLLIIDGTKIEKIDVIKSLGMHEGGRLTPAEIINQFNSDVLLCANLGSKAVQLLHQYGIKVFVGASGTVENTFEEWKKDNLRLADDESVCKCSH